ncbi:ETC complex I subunit [uncultured Bartonella sp.]|uniref:ETC complex I subunit n=1 Tax=uncultured Bartonella sp. TaxID=104108 RepID=UPI00261055ED|nr:ETC complex I subunit [uncultured Bartonella sp.]
MVARIFSPAKTAMQSGKANTGFWVLQYEPSEAKMIDPLMGYTSSCDMKSQINMTFDTQEEAIAFATKNGIAYEVEEPHLATRQKVSYSDNFRSNREIPWTH